MLQVQQENQDVSLRVLTETKTMRLLHPTSSFVCCNPFPAPFLKGYVSVGQQIRAFTRMMCAITHQAYCREIIFSAVL